jgi:phage-related protein
MRETRRISWLKAARRDFEEFPDEVQSDMLDVLTAAAEGGKSDKAKPFKGVDGGVFEIAVRHRGDAFRALYALKSGWIYGSSTLFRKSRNQESRRHRWRSTSSEIVSNDRKRY